MTAEGVEGSDATLTLVAELHDSFAVRADLSSERDVDVLIAHLR